MIRVVSGGVFLSPLKMVDDDFVVVAVAVAADDDDVGVFCFK